MNYRNRSRPVTARKGRVPPPGEERHFMKEKEALARARQWLKWWEVFRAGDSH